MLKKYKPWLFDARRCGGEHVETTSKDAHTIRGKHIHIGSGIVSKCTCYTIRLTKWTRTEKEHDSNHMLLALLLTDSGLFIQLAQSTRFSGFYSPLFGPRGVEQIVSSCQATFVGDCCLDLKALEGYAYLIPLDSGWAQLIVPYFGQFQYIIVLERIPTQKGRLF